MSSFHPDLGLYQVLAAPKRMTRLPWTTTASFPGLITCSSASAWWLPGPGGCSQLYPIVIHPALLVFSPLNDGLPTNPYKSCIFGIQWGPYHKAAKAEHRCRRMQEAVSTICVYKLAYHITTLCLLHENPTWTHDTRTGMKNMCSAYQRCGTRASRSPTCHETVLKLLYTTVHLCVCQLSITTHIDWLTSHKHPDPSWYVMSTSTTS